MTIWQQFAWNALLTLLLPVVPLLVTLLGKLMNAIIAGLEAEAQRKLSASRAETTIRYLELCRTLVLDAVTAAAQTVVQDAKAAGSWSPDLANQVKCDVLSVVKAKLGPDNQALAAQLNLDLAPILDDMIEAGVLHLARHGPARPPAAVSAAPPQGSGHALASRQ